MLKIKYVAIRTILIIIVGCTPLGSPATPTETRSLDSETLPESIPTNPPKEPTPAVPIPKSKPPPTEGPISEVPNPNAEPVKLQNPSFDDHVINGIPTGWENTGAAEAIYIEDGGHSGDFRLTHQGSLEEEVEVRMLFGEGEPSAPMINDSGGFFEYKPVSSLPPQSTFVFGTFFINFPATYKF